MKVQTFIVKAYKDSEVLTFERFSYKRPETIINLYRRRYAENRHGLWGLFWSDYIKADKITITATPDGYHEAGTVVEMKPQEFLQYGEV